MKHNEQLREGDSRLPAWRQIVPMALNRNATFFAATLPLRILAPFFNRYRGERNRYGAHVGGAIRATESGYVRADVSSTLFLSDRQDYDGGELAIADRFSTHGVKLDAVSMGLHRSSSMHEVTPVMHGERLARLLSAVRPALGRRPRPSASAVRPRHGPAATATALRG